MNEILSAPGELRELQLLRKLAEALNLEIGYDNVKGERCEASADSLLAVLAALGAPVSRMSDVPLALRHRRRSQWSRPLEPVIVAWDDEAPRARLRLPATLSAANIVCELQLESGEVHAWQCEPQDLVELDRRTVEGDQYVVLQLPLTDKLPWGYHELSVEIGGTRHRCTVISAPRRAYDPGCGLAKKSWGAFLPLYALHSSTSWGAGNFSDLGRLTQWAHIQGGEVVSTLPILSALLDEPFEPSPYSPATRLFWNEFYLDIEAIPELSHCPEAQALLRSSWFNERVSQLRSAELVDYKQQSQLQRQVLSLLSASFWSGDNARHESFRQFLQSRPDADDYARFRAVMERRRESWQQWPAALRNGQLPDGEFDEAAHQYHLYVQWIAAEQVEQLATRMKQSDMRLYLDLPLGVNRAGYDVWRNPSAFGVEASGGCPPDAVFTEGQNWLFPPLHPDGIREQGYRYVIDYLRHQLRYADILRIDHMPVFHRLYWVPPGASARDGVYVRYHADEFYAVFSLESHRHQALLIGEDLGTVPPEVPASMAVHHVHNMYVAQYAASDDPTQALPVPPRCSAASLNTHDMPPFAAYLAGMDIEQRQALDLLGNLDPRQEHEQRAQLKAALIAFLQQQNPHIDASRAAELLKTCLVYLGTSDARTILVNLEDLWLETEPQNIPGTDNAYPNWRRKARYTFEEFSGRPDVLAALRALDQAVKSNS